VRVIGCDVRSWQAGYLAEAAGFSGRSLEERRSKIGGCL